MVLLSCIWISTNALVRAEGTALTYSQQLGTAMSLCTYHSTLRIEMSLVNADNNFVSSEDRKVKGILTPWSC